MCQRVDEMQMCWAGWSQGSPWKFIYFSQFFIKILVKISHKILVGKIILRKTPEDADSCDEVLFGDKWTVTKPVGKSKKASVRAHTQNQKQQQKRILPFKLVLVQQHL